MNFQISKIAFVSTFFVLSSLVGCVAKTVTNRDQVRGTVKGILPQIKDCYVSNLKTNPTMKGKVMIKFEVDDAGHVPKCETKSTDLKVPAVESCICEKIVATPFPPAPKGQKAFIDYPFVFNYTD